MRRTCFALLLIVAACDSDKAAKPAGGAAGLSGSAGVGGGGASGARGGSSGAGGTAGRAGMGGSGIGGAVIDAAVDAPSVDAGMSDSPRDVASEPMPGAEAIVRSDAALPANSPYVYIASSSEIRIYQLDLMTGMLVGRDSVSMMGPPGTTLASYMVWNSKKTVMYIAHSVPNPAIPIPDGGLTRVAAVTAYAINGATGGLTKLGNSVPVPNTDGATHIGIHSDKYLYLANFGSSSVSVFGTNPDGSVASLIENKTMLATGEPYRMAHQALVDGNFLLVPCRDLAVVAQFVIDPSTGKLTDNTPATAMVPTMPLPPPDGGIPDGGVVDRGAGPRHLALSFDKKFAYVVNELQGTITVFGYDAAKGTLGAVVQNLLSGDPAGPREVQAAHPVITKTTLYVSNRSTKSIGVFKIDAMTGKLTLVEHEVGGGAIAFPRDFTIDPTGKFLLVANARNVPENLANVLEISPTDGSLTLKRNVEIAQGSQFAGALQLP